MLGPELLAAVPPLADVLDPASYLGETDAIVTAALEGWARVSSGDSRRRLEQLDRDAVGIAQVEREAAAVDARVDLDGRADERRHALLEQLLVQRRQVGRRGSRGARRRRYAARRRPAAVGERYSNSSITCSPPGTRRCAMRTCASG